VQTLISNTIADPVMMVYRSVGSCPGFTAGVDSIIYLFIYLLAFEVGEYIAAFTPDNSSKFTLS